MTSEDLDFCLAGVAVPAEVKAKTGWDCEDSFGGGIMGREAAFGATFLSGGVDFGAPVYPSCGLMI